MCVFFACYCMRKRILGRIPWSGKPYFHDASLFTTHSLASYLSGCTASKPVVFSAKGVRVCFKHDFIWELFCCTAQASLSLYVFKIFHSSSSNIFQASRNPLLPSKQARIKVYMAASTKATGIRVWWMPPGSGPRLTLEAHLAQFSFLRIEVSVAQLLIWYYNLNCLLICIVFCNGGWGAEL